MQTIGNMFYVVLFLSAIGSVFCVLSLFISHVLRCTLPLWFALCGMALFCVPFLSPDVVLIPPEPQHWRGGFRIACAVWLGGCAVLLVWHALRAWLAGRGLKRCRPCHDERLAALCLRCAAAAGIKKPPALYWGAPGTPICVTGALRPAVIMDRTVIEKLTDAELSAVFFHELTHIRRRHILWERLYDCVCIMNWPNPFVWIARGDFSLHCETDCDTHALRSAHGQITQAQYAAAILRLLEPGPPGPAVCPVHSPSCWQSAGSSTSSQGHPACGTGRWPRCWRFLWRSRSPFRRSSAGSISTPIRPTMSGSNTARVTPRDPYSCTL